MKHDSTYSDKDFGRLQSELEEHFGQFKDENSVLKDKVRKLKTIYKGLSAKEIAEADRKKPKKIASTMAGPKKARPLSSKTVRPYVACLL